MKQEVIVILTPQQWTHPLSGNAKDYALEFSAENKVVYVNLPLDINTVLRKSRAAEDRLRLSLLKKLKPEAVQVRQNLWEVYPATVLLSVNFISFRPLYNLLNRINNYLFARSIKSVLKKLNLSPTVIFNDNLMTKGRYVAGQLKPRLNIYYLRDNFENHNYYKKNNLRDQEELMSAASVVFTNSEYLREKALRFNPNSFNVGQGLRFSENTVNGLSIEQFLTPPVIGYLGNLTTLRLDLELLETAIANFPAHTFLFVGPVDGDFANSRLNDYPNVYFTGPCEPEMAGSFIRLFDVAINPQLVNEMTIGNYPRKIDEYLMYGKPVVSIETEAMEMFREFVYLARNAEEFCDSIKKAIAENNPEMPAKRHAFASQHTWEASKKKIYSIVSDL